MKILLTSSRAPVTLDLARKFHLQGHHVTLCDSLKYTCASFSQRYHQFKRVPRPVHEPVAYIEALESIIQSEQIDFLIPTCEEVFFIASFRDKLSCPVLVDSIDKLQKIHNKWLFSQIPKYGNVEVPETHLLKTLKDVAGLKRQTDEFVFKPVYSRFASETLVQPTTAQLASIQTEHEYPWVAQKFIKGREFSTYSVANEGKLVAHSSYVSLYKAGLGSGIYFQNCPNDSLKTFVEQYLADIKYTGQIGFDAIEDEQGKTWVIEGNPRATSGLHLFDDQAPIVDRLLGKSDPLLIGSKPQCMVGFAMPIWGLAHAFQKGKLLKYFRDIWLAPDVLFRWNDPLPAITIGMPLMELVWLSFREQKSLQQVSTYDLEWNGQPL